MKYTATFRENLTYKHIRKLMKMSPADQLDFFADNLVLVDAEGHMAELDDLPFAEAMAIVESVSQGFTTTP